MTLPRYLEALVSLSVRARCVAHQAPRHHKGLLASPFSCCGLAVPSRRNDRARARVQVARPGHTAARA